MKSVSGPVLLGVFLGALPVFGQVPSNDTCDGALPILLDGQEMVGSTLTANDDESPSCAVAAGGKDVVYRFTLDTTSDLTVDTKGSNFDTVLSV